MKLISWNVNGLRAVLDKGLLRWLKRTAPDVLCLQETKLNVALMPPELKVVRGYHVYYSHASRPGYSGVGTWSRAKPLAVGHGFGEPRFDDEGRILQTDHGAFVLLNIYFPNGKKDDERLRYKLAFYDATLAYCQALRRAGRRLVICGDVNTAHHEIDLARPKDNVNVSGFLRVERDWLDRWTAAGYVDTFRRLHPGTAAYSWWSQRTAARDRDVGWRLDYFYVSDDLWPQVRAADILGDVEGSDHCPVTLELDG